MLFRSLSTELAKIVRPLQNEVREQELWACHLGPELGGQGYGQVKLALINEILGRTAWGPVVFGCQAPDTGNAEILAKFGTDEQKARWLEPIATGHRQGRTDRGQRKSTLSCDLARAAGVDRSGPL